MTTLSTLTTNAQYRCDRANATSITTAEWTSYINASVQELYGVLCSTYEDWNVKATTLTLTGGDPPANQVSLGQGNTITDFLTLRAVWWQAAPSPGVRWLPLRKCAGLLERHRYLGPNVSLIYGSSPSVYLLYGNVLEILPPQASGGVYQILYVPQMPLLVNPSDDIAPYWLSVNGWDEYVVLDAAAKALIKEESLETASLLLQQKEQLKARILNEAKPRDDGEAGRIQDVQNIRTWDFSGSRGGDFGWW